jgi:hypothetical protein
VVFGEGREGLGDGLVLLLEVELDLLRLQRVLSI